MNYPEMHGVDIMPKMKLIRIGLVLTAALLILLSQVTAPTAAEAAVHGCRGDPILYLSDGTVMTITVDIDADASAVSKNQLFRQSAERREAGEGRIHALSRFYR